MRSLSKATWAIEKYSRSAFSLEKASTLLDPSVSIFLNVLVFVRIFLYLPFFPCLCCPCRCIFLSTSGCSSSVCIRVCVCVYHCMCDCVCVCVYMVRWHVGVFQSVCLAYSVSSCYAPRAIIFIRRGIFCVRKQALSRRKLFSWSFQLITPRIPYLLLSSIRRVFLLLYRLVILAVMIILSISNTTTNTIFMSMLLYLSFFFFLLIFLFLLPFLSLLSSQCCSFNYRLLFLFC